MVNLITLDGSGHKVARPVTSRDEYIALRNAEENVKCFYDARQGNDAAKGKQLQFNYNDLLPDGVLRGCCHPSSTFAHDIDCNDAEEQVRIREVLLAHRDEIGLLELSGSARYGLHAVCRRELGKTILENQVRLSTLTQTEMDTSVHDLQRVLYTGPATSDNLFYLDDAIFDEALTAEESAEEYQRLKERESNGMEKVPAGAKKANKHYRPWEDGSEDVRCKREDVGGESEEPRGNEDEEFPSDYHGIPFTEILKKYWEINNHGFEPNDGDRDTLTYQLACDLRHICGKKFKWLDQVIPCYNGFTLKEKREKIRSALNSELESFPARLRSVLNALESPNAKQSTAEEDEQLSIINSQLSMKKMPQGVRESIEAIGPAMAMPIVTAICPCIGALATGVALDVHGKKKGLNLIAYIAGDFASGKGDIDPVVEAWMSEVRAQDRMYQTQEDEWRAKKLAAKNKKEQPVEPKLPVRFLPLNNTVANLAERLANTDGKHAFSFTPEADTVAQKWRSAMSDFSVMLRQSYDGSRYDREAKSVDAVNVHIEHLLWNVTMCGTPDALYRVVSNYTDGFQSRIAIARTPDNTFAPLEDKPYILTDQQQEQIRQIAHLLPLMQGEVVLTKLEAKSREWVENVRLETIKNDDKVKARQRFRVCVTAQRMTCCLMLCKVAEQLIQKHGVEGAETQLKAHPNLWKSALMNVQTPAMLGIYDIIADYLLEMALCFFRERIENAFASRDYAGNRDRRRMGKNDSIFERLDVEFGFDGALQHSVAVKGAGVSHNSVRQMLKNWKKQGLIVQTEEKRYRKVENLEDNV